MRNDRYLQRRLELCAAAERALDVAVAEHRRQITYRDLARSWDAANAGSGVELPVPPNWLKMFKPALDAGRVICTRQDGSIFFAPAAVPELEIPRKEVVYTAKRLEIAAAAQRALTLALERSGQQVTWKEVRAAWPEANRVEVAPYHSVTSWGWVFEPLVRSGEVIVTRVGGGTFYSHRDGPGRDIPTKPAYTAERLEKCRAAVEVIRAALLEAGTQVTFGEIGEVWARIRGAGFPTISTHWVYIIQPALDAGDVLATKRGNWVYYTLAELDTPLPEEPAESAWLMERCADAEAALRRLLDADGHQVSWERLIQELGVDPEGAQQKLRYYLRPAFEAARVIATKVGPRTYLTSSDAADYPIPVRTRGPRVLGSAVAKRVASLVAAVKTACARTGRMADIATVIDELPPEARDGRTLRRPHVDLELACQRGELRSEFTNRHWYFAPADRPHLEPPPFASDLHRVEEAVRRATARLRSAVAIAEIEQQIDADPDLQLTSTLAVADVLGSLRQHDRVLTTSHVTRVKSKTGYHYLPGGPAWVRPEAEHLMDRRFRAAAGLWRASGGRPFTTAAVRRYASTRKSLQFEGSRPYDWTNALQNLAARGDLVRIKQEGLWQVRWALREEWEALSPEERAKRLHDPYRTEAEEDGVLRAGRTGLYGNDASEHDVAFVSQTRNFRTLILMAKALRASREADAGRRSLQRNRPVTVSELITLARVRPVLAPKGRLSAVIQLAARHQERMKRTTLVHVGTVGKVSYYDVKRSENGVRYLAYLAAYREADPSQVRRRVDALRLAADQSVLRVVPLPDFVVNARVHALRQDVTRRARALVKAARGALLLSEEKAQAVSRVRQLRHYAARCYSFALSKDMDASPAAMTVDAHRIYPAEALGEVGQYFEPGLAPSLLPGRLGLAGRVAADPEEAQRMRITRPVRHAIDRVGFACYAAARWGGASLRALAQQARHAMGELRFPEPFIETLLDAESTPTHSPAAAVLGFFDDTRSRAALAEYLQRSVALPGVVAPGTTAAGAEAAVYGLARLPFGSCATILSDNERTALELARNQGFDDRVRAIAGRVIESWEEGWSQERLLFL